MSEYEYERVEGMTDLDVVAAMLDSNSHYKNLDGTSYMPISFCDIPCISAWLIQGLVYTRKERPWWEGCEGSVVMVRDSDENQWKFDVFTGYNEYEPLQFECVRAYWRFMRPLTQAERDAIKVKD